MSSVGTFLSHSLWVRILVLRRTYFILYESDTLGVHLSMPLMYAVNINLFIVNTIKPLHFLEVQLNF